jgi:hypothetical protein
MVIFHPPVKVIIVPTSFGTLPVPADWPDNVRGDPGAGVRNKSTPGMTALTTYFQRIPKIG